MSILPVQLPSFPVFDGLKSDELQHVIESMETLTFCANESIIHEGVSVQALWILLSGECVVTRSCGPDNDRVLAVLNSGDIFGEMSFVRSAPHSATIRTKSKVQVCRYDKSAFEKLTQQHPGTAMQIVSNIAAVLAERLRRMDNWVCDFIERPEESEHRDEWEVFRSAVYTNWSF